MKTALLALVSLASNSPQEQDPLTAIPWPSELDHPDRNAVELKLQIDAAIAGKDGSRAAALLLRLAVLVRDAG